MITRDHYAAGKSMVFRVEADSFGSDPDIYISADNEYPSSVDDSTWYCNVKGSETCIIKEGEIGVGETIYFGIHCQDECTYKMQVWYAEMLELTKSKRQQFRLEAYSTQIVRIEIPKMANGLRTTSMTIRLESEEQYSAMDVWLSYDDDLRIIEQRPASHMDARAIGVVLSELDYDWCTDCGVYAILSVSEMGRYYVTAEARSGFDPLQNGLRQSVFLNPFQQSCFQYYVKVSKAVVRVDVDGFQGQADLYVQPQ